MLSMKTLRVAILIVILVVSIAHIGTTHHICRLKADSWIKPEEGIWPFSYFQGSEAGVSMHIHSPAFLDGHYVPGVGITAGKTASRGEVSFLYGIYENGFAVSTPEGGYKADGVACADYRLGYKVKSSFYEWRYGDGAESLTVISQGVITIENEGFEDRASSTPSNR